MSHWFSSVWCFLPSGVTWQVWCCSSWLWGFQTWPILISCPNLLQVRCCQSGILWSSGKRCRVSCSSALLCFTPEAIRSAVDHLELLGAVEKKDGQVFLTTLGKKMASFPLEPRYAKVNPAGSALIFFVHKVKDKVSAHKQITPLFAPHRRPSCCPQTTRVRRRFWASCRCCLWTPCCTTLRLGGTRCLQCARSSCPVKETTWHC